MKFKNKVIIISIIGGLLVGSIMLGISYALWQTSISQTGSNTIVSDCFEITYKDQDDIRLNNAYPVTDEVGSSLTPYKFIIKNVCQNATSYQINLETLASSSLAISNLRMKLNSNSVANLNEQPSAIATLTGANDARIIESGVLFSKEEKVFNLRIWLKDTLTPEDDIQNKTYVGKVNVIATLNKNAKKITLNLNGGTLDSTMLNVSVGSEIGTLPEPTKNDFTFAGWYSDIELTQKVTSETVVTTSLNNLYAKWDS